MGRGQRTGLIAAALVVAVLAFVLLSPSDSDDDDVTPPTATETRPQGTQKGGKPAPKPKPSFSVIRVKGGEPAGGVQRLNVRKGATVRLEVRSDRAGEIHVHGYDLKTNVKARGSTRFTFRADIEGVFEIELEDTHTQIGQLVVEP